MSKFNKNHIVSAFSDLGLQLLQPTVQLLSLIESEHLYNPWFTPPNVEEATQAIGAMLNEESLTAWLNKYPQLPVQNKKKIGLILAGNIPLVGFHDILCVLAAGHHALIKTSGGDARLIRHVLQMLTDIAPGFAGQFTFVERLADFDAVIATGSNNSSRYFEYYFGKVPHIIRKNRNSVSLLTGDEDSDTLYKLGHDIFDYFGLGCRNVAKLMVPENYHFPSFFEAIESYQPIINHHKYHNNYDYNKSILLVNKNKHLDNGFLLLKEDTALSSPLAVLHYEVYTDIQSAQDKLRAGAEGIQCVVSHAGLQVGSQVVDFGQSQCPALWDYADGVDTMEFLSNLYTFEAKG